MAAEVRGAGAGELSAVREIISQAWSNPEDEPALWDYLAANHPGMRPECVRVAEADGQLVASRLDHERRGYGSAVFRDALAYMAGRGLALAVLGGDPGFYGRFGCAPILPICRTTLEVNAASPPAAVESPVPYSAGSDADLRPVTQNDLRRVAALYRWGLSGYLMATSRTAFTPCWPSVTSPATLSPPRRGPARRDGAARSRPSQGARPVLMADRTALTQLVVGYRGIDDLLLAGHAEATSRLPTSSGSSRSAPLFCPHVHPTHGHRVPRRVLPLVRPDRPGRKSSDRLQALRELGGGVFMTASRRELLEGGLVLRQAESAADLEGVYRLLTHVFDESVSCQAQAMDRYYPGPMVSRYFIVEDPSAPPLPAGPAYGTSVAATRVAATEDAVPRVVSVLRLTPMAWRLEGLRLPVANLEYAATDPPYRGRGLQKALSRKFDEVAGAEDYLLAGVLGIPGFYSGLGYTFASPIDESASLAGAETLKAVEEDPLRYPSRSFVTRPWDEGDLPAVAELWEERAQALDLCLERDQALWKFHLDFEPLAGRRYVVTEGRRVVGCFAMWCNPSGLLVYDLAALQRDVILEIYRFAAASVVAASTGSDGQPRVFLRIPESGAAYAVAMQIRARAERSYGWQMKVCDRPGLLRAMAPVLERRLASSPFRGLSASLVLNFYTSRVTLVWAGGRLSEVVEESTGGIPVTPGAGGLPAPSSPVRVCLPAETFVQLALGYRTLSDLMRERQDVLSPRALAALVETLFPRLAAWVEP